MRGKDRGHQTLFRADGITPACAGKRFASAATSAPLRDHPRVCGEKVLVRGADGLPAGSPPRVRGKVKRMYNAGANRGITPACAGKRVKHCVLRSFCLNHPRVCGEKVIHRRLLSIGRGSPPRARGKVRSNVRSTNSVGITPACAGKRGVFKLDTGAPRDHPRVRGEKSSASLPAPPKAGSPPRARGKGTQFPATRGWSKITPACAGKRNALLRAGFAVRNHPRVRGEKAALPPAAPRRAKSPPRARGKDGGWGRRDRPPEITPSCAGKRENAVSSPVMPLDHPRVCGEKWDPADLDHGTEGSPPRVRGKVYPDAVKKRTFGITPARAGKRISTGATA